MQQRVMILNGSLSEIPLIEEAHKLGYYVVTSGNAPSLIGHAYADEYIPCDYSDKEAVLDLVRKHRIDRIISCANDFGAITASYVAEKMGWPGHDSYETTLLMHQKDIMKSFFLSNGIRTPESVPFQDKHAAEAYVKHAKYPLIVKATDLTGGKGINRADNVEQAQKAVEIAFDTSRVGHIVIEEFVVGHQESIVGFIANKKIICAMSCNCYSPINPYLIQSEIMPSDYYQTLKNELVGIMQTICDLLDLKDGVLTLQYIVQDGVPYIIELMKRCLGNQFLTPVSAVTGFPWHEGLVRAEIGLDCSNLKVGTPIARNAGHHGIMTTRNGIIRSVTIPENIREHVFKEYTLLRPGDKIENHRNERVGYLYYAYDHRDEILDAVEHFNERIVVEFEN